MTSRPHHPGDTGQHDDDAGEAPFLGRVEAGEHSTDPFDAAARTIADAWFYGCAKSDSPALVGLIANGLRSVDRAAREECADTAARIMVEYDATSLAGIVAQRIANTILATIKD